MPQRGDKPGCTAYCFKDGNFIEVLYIYTVIESRWHSPYISVYKDALLTYLLVSVPSILTLKVVGGFKQF